MPRPHIYAREELLKDVIRECRVRDLDTLVPGTRVAVYWSTKYQFMHPGTVVAPLDVARPKFVNVELDDGDSRNKNL